MTEIIEIARAIEKLHGAKATHVDSVPVSETFQGLLIWRGSVEVYALAGHRSANRCYAWKHWEDDKGKRSRIVAVLETPPVWDAVSAVRAAIVSEVKQNRSN